MAASEILFFFLTIFSFFFFCFFSNLPHVAANITTCREATCGIAGDTVPDLTVKFPFRLRGIQSRRCGFGTRFDLSCNKRNQTVLRLGSGEFAVQSIDYDAQSLWINDNHDCLPRRFLDRDFDIPSTDPFKIDRRENYKFLNCSMEWAIAMSLQLWTISCLSNQEYAVFALPNRMYGGPPLSDSTSPSPSPSPSSSFPCSVISTAMVPVQVRPFPWRDGFSQLGGDIRLTWSDPDCRDCLASGGACGVETGSNSTIGCSASSSGSNHGMPFSLFFFLLFDFSSTTVPVSGGVERTGSTLRDEQRIDEVNTV